MSIRGANTHIHTHVHSNYCIVIRTTKKSKMNSIYYYIHAPHSIFNGSVCVPFICLLVLHCCGYFLTAMVRSSISRPLDVGRLSSIGHRSICLFPSPRCKFLIENAYKSISCGILMKHFSNVVLLFDCLLLPFFFTFDLFDIANVRKIRNFPFLVVDDHLLLSTTSAVLYMYIGLSACATIKQSCWFCSVFFFREAENDIYDRWSSVAWWHFLDI